MYSRWIALALGGALMAGCGPLTLQAHTTQEHLRAARGRASQQLRCPGERLVVEADGTAGYFKAGGCGREASFYCESITAFEVGCWETHAAHPDAAPGDTSSPQQPPPDAPEPPAPVHEATPKPAREPAPARKCLHAGCLSSGDPSRRPYSVGLELAGTARPEPDASQWALSPRLRAHYRVDRRWQLALDWGTALLSRQGDDGSGATTFGAGNPLASARYHLVDGALSQVSFAAGLTAPVAHLGDDVRSGQRRTALALAAGMRGLWDPWLWAPGQAAITTVGTAETMGPLGLHLRSEAGLGAGLSVSNATREAGDLQAQLALELSQLSHHGLGFGWRVQGVWMTAPQDPLQFAIAPFVVLELPLLRMRAQWLLNLDEPLGVGGAGLDLWGASLTVEYAP